MLRALAPPLCKLFAESGSQQLNFNGTDIDDLVAVSFGSDCFRQPSIADRACCC
jgi:hypothetical protein